MNLLSYDEILRLIPVAILATANIIVAYYLTALPMDGHVKQLERRLDA